MFTYIIILEKIVNNFSHQNCSTIIVIFSAPFQNIKVSKGLVEHTIFGNERPINVSYTKDEKFLC